MITLLEHLTQGIPCLQSNKQIIYPITANPSEDGKSDAQSLGVHLHPHTEYSYQTFPPKWLGLLCKTPDSLGKGATTVVNFPDLLRHFTISEQDFLATQIQCFMSKDKKQKNFSSIWHPKSKILRFSYNVLARKEFSPDIHQPIASDVNPLLIQLCDKVLNLFEAYHSAIKLEAEQILVIDNHICLHSREAYDDPNRYLERVMLNPF